VVWLVIVSRLGGVPVTPRQRRFDLVQMSSTEKRWSLLLVVSIAGLIAWLNGAATVDWSPLAAAIGAGKAGPALFAAGLIAFLAAMIAGIWISWRRERAAFLSRKGASRP
jgi:hypothetical protein